MKGSTLYSNLSCLHFLVWSANFFPFVRTATSFLANFPRVHFATKMHFLAPFLGIVAVCSTVTGAAISLHKCDETRRETYRFSRLTQIDEYIGDWCVLSVVVRGNIGMRLTKNSSDEKYLEATRIRQHCALVSGECYNISKNPNSTHFYFDRGHTSYLSGGCFQ